MIRWTHVIATALVIAVPALGQTPDQRHLTAFETETNAAAGAGFLAFVSLAAGLSMARTLAAA